MVPGVVGMIAVEFLGRADEVELSEPDAAFLNSVVDLWRDEREPEPDDKAKAVALLRQHADVMSPSMQSLLERL